MRSTYVPGTRYSYIVGTRTLIRIGTVLLVKPTAGRPGRALSGTKFGICTGRIGAQKYRTKNTERKIPFYHTDMCTLCPGTAAVGRYKWGRVRCWAGDPAFYGESAACPRHSSRTVASLPGRRCLSREPRSSFERNARRGNEACPSRSLPRWTK